MGKNDNPAKNPTTDKEQREKKAKKIVEEMIGLYKQLTPENKKNSVRR